MKGGSLYIRIWISFSNSKCVYAGMLFFFDGRNWTRNYVSKINFYFRL